MDKLLQEAIADAKAVRETALANAKLALEEAFTPHLKSMLSKKLQAEMENEEEEADDAGDDAGEPEADPFDDGDDSVEEVMDSSDIGKADNKKPSDASNDDDGQGPEEEGSPSGQGDEDDEAEEAPDQAVGENFNFEQEDGEEESPEDDAGMEDEPADEEPAEDDVDLEQVLRELEQEMAMEEEGDEEEEAPEAPAPEEPDDEEPAEEELDLEAIIRALSEEGEEEEEEEAPAPDPEEESVHAELAEYKQTVQYLKEKLSEVNLLNAKLLYTNKLFRSRNVSQEQKMKVIEQFDRAANVREVKLVYTTFAESMKRKPVNESARKKSQASKPVASTKGKRPIIGEHVDFKTRMKKLANII
jgi:hypothetical protein